MKYVGDAYLPIPEKRDPVDPALHIKNYALAVDGKEEAVVTTLAYPPTLPASAREGDILRVAYRDSTPNATNETYYWDLQYTPNQVRTAAYPYRIVGEATPLIWKNDTQITLPTSPSVYAKVTGYGTGLTFPFKGYWDIEAEAEFDITTQNGDLTAAISGPLSTSNAANNFCLMHMPITATLVNQTSKMRRSMRRLVTSTTVPLDFWHMGFSAKAGRFWRIRATPLEVGP